MINPSANFEDACTLMADEMRDEIDREIITELIEAEKHDGSR